jgi:hypothetical protein
MLNLAVELGGGGYWEGCKLEDEAVRARMSAYDLGVADHLSLQGALTQQRRYRRTVAIKFAAA